MAVLSNIRQRSALMIAVIVHYLHLSLAIYSVVVALVLHQRWEHQWQGYLI
jgi:hypothetical protein